ncbi:Kef-type K+ transport system, membrane component KefB [Salinihabitans flavidus]|uniref:Kef-type K+ transport system, membrane component KefB n=1 Tax=Salinihabitans flavidus TaxID=569882 RepID=A0A1H8VY78_9RHOB|nr:cation:proton antiporter [Salinihabitans flavidus]SEP20305.1 Kef-type K+ transport system, membrane component KefB [Salinihabitans flavidus]
MIDTGEHHAAMLLLMGLVSLLAVPMRAAFARISMPSMIGFIVLGVSLSIGSNITGVASDTLNEQVPFLAKIGIVVLLFRIGLESDLDKLRQQLGRAALIWLPNMVLGATTAFALVMVWPGLGLIPALFTGVAASATSIGVSAGIWEATGALDSDTGALLLDAAELDDVSAVVLLSVLFAVGPLLKQPEGAAILAPALKAGAIQLLLTALFSMNCYLFSRWLEKPLSDGFAKLAPKHGPIVLATGAAFVIAAMAEVMGLSMAIGALFAGLAFSRDPAERSIDEAFGILLTVFGPFFFVAIGLSVDLTVLVEGIGLAAALAGMALLGKLLGAGLPATAMLGWRQGALIGFSMVPRAEIFLLVMLYGLTLGPWAVPQVLYNAAVLASIATCIIGPAIVGMMLRPLAGNTT